MVYNHLDTNFIVLDISTDILGYTRRNLALAFDGKPIDNVWLTHFNV